jgi:adenylylsulfate kinase-like enzyme
VKGLYARARRGEIAHFTGVSDIYEIPSISELVIDTATTSVADAVAQLMAHI